VEDGTVPLQNRVLPTGEIIVNPARGLMLGNRGCLHGQGRELGVSHWRSKAWICCVLDWKGVRRDPMPPGRWTALFFLDEATALAAGHRPCGYCRRSDFLGFAAAWQAAQRLARRPRAGEMDAVLHGERVDRTRRQVTRTMDAGQLPDGVMIRTGGDLGLLIGGRLRAWSLTGYGAAAAVSGPVEVLTPPAIIAAIAAGYQPMVHPTASPESRPADGLPPRVRFHNAVGLGRALGAVLAGAQPQAPGRGPEPGRLQGQGQRRITAGPLAVGALHG
jgi:hypothetical protein